MKIYGQMAAILKDFPTVTKDQKNTGGGNYSYRGIDDALAALHPLLAKHGVFMALTNLEPEYHDAGKTKAGASVVRCVLTGTVRFYADDGSFVEVSLAGEGIDTADKALMKSQANGLKYVCWYTFCVPTLEKKDSEAFADEEVAAPAPAPIRTKKAAPKVDVLGDQLKLSAAKTREELAEAWASIRPGLVSLPADDSHKRAMVAEYTKRMEALQA